MQISKKILSPGSLTKGVYNVTIEVSGLKKGYVEGSPPQLKINT
ncbi:unnamed protein product, partial [Vitis vinifera]|uniref:Uncharacterized protein n=1 Tax=Vitis vinifera TaxID=29760 RepID=D7U7V3_VITVI